jgi:dihydrofolate reductase
MEAILACTHDGGIGLNGELPWRLKEDMKLFKTITTTIQNPNDEDKLNAVIMGRNTWESIPKKFRPLPNRINIILSTTMDKKEIEVENFIYVVRTLEELDRLEVQLKKEEKLATPFIIGGATLYNKMFELDKISKVHLSLLNKDCEYECDTFFDIKYMNREGWLVNKIQTFDKFSYFKYWKM